MFRQPRRPIGVKAAKTSAPVNVATASAIRARKNLVIPSNTGMTILFDRIARKNAPPKGGVRGGRGRPPNIDRNSVPRDRSVRCFSDNGRQN